MALTPEDVVNKRFQQTKFREGYDQDEVDDFLDEIVVELRRLTQENEELRAKLDALEARQGNGPSPVSVPAPVVAAVVAPTPIPVSEEVDTTSSNNLLQLARRLHEEHVREGVQKRDELIAEGHETATRLVLEAETAQRASLKKFESDKSQLMTAIDELKSFESEYRQKLHVYISSELANLDAMSVPNGGPVDSSAKA
ncbi:MAG: DivIVA domain-containing protein [Alpinimonas sp.]|jgi:cell division initiation protein